MDSEQTVQCSVKRVYQFYTDSVHIVKMLCKDIVQTLYIKFIDSKLAMFRYCRDYKHCTDTI